MLAGGLFDIQELADLLPPPLPAHVRLAEQYTQLMQLARKAPKEALAPVIQALEERGTHAGIHFKNTPRKYARFLAEAIAMSHQKEQVVCKRLDQLLELHERSGSTGQMRLLTAIRKSIRACQRI